jgi:AbiV family abortive infection protein
MVTERFLLEGALYALENSGALLRDAVALYERGSYASAIVMAMFGREELGKYRMLRDAFEKAAAGEPVELADLTKKKGALYDHVAKQERGALSVVQRPGPGTRLHELLRAQFDLPWGSPEREKANKELHEVTQRMAQELPKQRHVLRMDALYVGLSEDGSSWVRPQETTAEEARHEVEHAICDYNVAQSRLDDGVDKEQAFLAAFRAWAERPKVEPVVAPRLELG